MLDTKGINEQLYQSSLAAVDWDILSRNARLSFWDDNVQLDLCLEGIHCAIFRPTLRTEAESFGRNCHVFFADISQETAFLDKYINDEKLLVSHVTPHDAGGYTPSDRGFRRPYHLTIVCVCGHLDFIFNSAHVDRQDEQ